MSADQSSVASNAVIEAYRRHSFGEAERLFGEALAQNPGWAEAAYNRGLMLVQLGQMNEALACLQRALNIRPEYPAALATRAGIWVAACQTELALRDYTTVMTHRFLHRSGR